VTKVVADALQEGQYVAYQGMQARTFEPEFEPEPAAASVEPREEERRPIQLSEEEMAFFGATVEESPAEPSEDAEREGTDTSASWAAPAEPGDQEAPTHPSVTGTSDAEPIEAEMDSVIEPETQETGQTEGGR
jgi:hypothetical protein